MMTISLTPEVETRLRAKAEREGLDVNRVVEELLMTALEWEEQDREEAIAGIRLGLKASAEGRVRSANEVFAKMRDRLAEYEK